MTDFIKTLRRYLQSGVGVVAIRTRDPMSAASDVANYCSAAQKPIRMWDCVRGWIKGDDPVLGHSAGEPASRDILNCFTSVMDAGAVTPEMPANGVFVFINPHLFLNKANPHPPLVQMLSIMAYALPTQFRRVVLTVPPYFNFPADLQELIPVIDNPPPSVRELSDSAEQVMVDYREKHPKIVTRMDANSMQRVAQAGIGMILPEFEASLARVLTKAADDQTPTETESVRRAILHEKAEMVRRNRSLEVLAPVLPEQVGGLHNLKDWIKTRASAMQPEAWEQGVDKPKGCALVGPPGTGKSLCAKMVGSVLGVATIRFDIASVFAGLVGASEENMREALFLIEGLAPCVVLVDEIDKAIQVSSGGDGGTSQKVLGTLLTFMQETKQPIFWMLTMNRVDNIPAELLRAGRLDQVFGVGVPNDSERMEILRYHLRARGVDPDKVPDLHSMIPLTDRYIGAEIESIASEARLLAYNAGEAVQITHLLEAHSNVRPLSKRMGEQFRAMESWCKENATPANRPDEAATVPAVPTTRARRRLIQ